MALPALELEIFAPLSSATLKLVTKAPPPLPRGALLLERAEIKSATLGTFAAQSAPPSPAKVVAPATVEPLKEKEAAAATAMAPPPDPYKLTEFEKVDDDTSTASPGARM